MVAPSSPNASLGLLLLSCYALLLLRDTLSQKHVNYDRAALCTALPTLIAYHAYFIYYFLMEEKCENCT